MGTSTFSGPLLSGTTRQGATRNLGTPVLVQTYVIPVADMTTAGVTRTAFYLPAGSAILEASVQVVTAIATATNLGITIGRLGAAANLYYTSFNTGLTVGKVADSTVGAAQQVVQTSNVGTADVGITITSTAATSNATTGSVIVAIAYIQRNSDGTITPTP